jgi:hypothetical protein
MKADFDRLVTGAESAATSAAGGPFADGDVEASLAVAISCVGRRATVCIDIFGPLQF